MRHTPHHRSITDGMCAAILGAALLGLAGFQTAPTTAPTTQPTTQPTTRPVLPKISIYRLGLQSGVDITITPEGVFTYTQLEDFHPKKWVTITLNESQIARLATAVQETLGRPSRPHRMPDYYMKVTIGEQTWESHDHDDKFSPLYQAVYKFEPKD